MMKCSDRRRDHRICNHNLSNCYLKYDYNCYGHIFISFVFPQFTSFHSVFHSFHGLMNSINWPALHVWVFIAQLVEHGCANADATGSNPVEAPKKVFFFGLFRNCLNFDSLRWLHLHFIRIFPAHNSFHSVFHSFHGLMNSINWPASSVWVFIASVLHSTAARTQRPQVRTPWKPQNVAHGLSCLPVI